MRSYIKGDYEVSTDGKTVWVNAADGACVARFSKMGIDIHKDMAGQMAGGSQCLDCKPGPLTPEDWMIFRMKMVSYYNIIIPPGYIPSLT